MTAIVSRFTTTDVAATFSTGDTLTLAEDGYLVSTFAEALFLEGTAQSYDATIDGLISARASDDSVGIWLSGSTNDADITIGAAGVVRGGMGIYLEGNGKIINDGYIAGIFNASVLFLDEGAYSVVNNGTIVSDGASGLYFHSTANGKHTIKNTGEITSDVAGAAGIKSISASAIELVNNTGVINGGMSLGGGRDVVHNDKGQGVVNGSSFLGDGADKYYGGAFGDHVYGDAGADYILGNGGNDMIIGGSGKDKIWGGAGKDVFVFRDVLTKANVDEVKDFNHSDDLFYIDNSVFKGMKGGDVTEAAFTTIASATSAAGVDKSDRILYDKAHGDIYFDRDGSGKHYSRQLVAHLEDGISIDNSDFYVI